MSDSFDEFAQQHNIPFGLRETFRACWDEARTTSTPAIAQGTTHAAGVGEQAQAEPMSNEDLRTKFNAWANGMAPAFAPEFEKHRAWAEGFAWLAVRYFARAILAEAGIKDKQSKPSEAQESPPEQL